MHHSPSRRALLSSLGVAAVGLVAGCAGPSGEPERAFAASSPAMTDGGELPDRFTCAGDGVSPPIVVERAPEPTAAFAVAAEFDQGPLSEPIFWTLWNVPAARTEIPAALPRAATVEALDGARQGRRRGGEVGYEPPCPPAGEPIEHRFQVYALSRDLEVAGGARHDDAEEAIGDAVLASDRITVDYTRPADGTG